MRIIHFADLHMGVENYSRIDPATGVSNCLVDFQRSFDNVVEFSLRTEADLVIFCGDAYKSRDPSQTHQREFARRVGMLAAGGIPVFLLVGNHDLPNAIGRATAIEIFDTLAIENVIVANQPGVYPVKTKKGIIQIAALPWLRRNSLLTREDTRRLNVEELKLRLGETLTRVIEDNIRKLDPDLPAILAAHVTVASATHGSERAMILGQDPVLPLNSVAKAAFDYVALGHMHKSQILSHIPPVVYSGSLQRIDFSDEGNDKGFYVVEIDPRKKRGERATFEFHHSRARRFLTIETVVAANDPNPTTTVLQDIARRSHDIAGAIVRVQITIPQHVERLIHEPEIQAALREAQYISITKEVLRERRARLNGWSAEEMSPSEALKVYLALRKTPREHARTLLGYGERLIQETVED
ncbi:MAG: exonuclease SbcCD subunit D [Chloroflexi bacterium]|nr:exonuclease SbcCD subunit D [Chloroflexota bacterium]